MHIIAVGMYQYGLDMVGVQAFEAALDGKAGVPCTEIECRAAFSELLAYLADNHPVLALALEQLAQPFFTDAVGRCSVQQIESRSEERRVGKECRSLSVRAH